MMQWNPFRVTLIKLYVQMQAEYDSYGLFNILKYIGSLRRFEDCLVFVFRSKGKKSYS
jgi:hypothetical protein